MHSLFDFEKTSKYSQYSWGTSFWASSRVDSSTSPLDSWFFSAYTHVSWDSLSNINLEKHVSMSDLHSGGQHDNLMSLVVQSISGLCFLSQSCEVTQGQRTKNQHTHKLWEEGDRVGLGSFERKPKESSNGEPLGAGLQTIYTTVHKGHARLSIGLCTVHDIIVELDYWHQGWQCAQHEAQV